MCVIDLSDGWPVGEIIDLAARSVYKMNDSWGKIYDVYLKFLFQVHWKHVVYMTVFCNGYHSEGLAVVDGVHVLAK